MRPSGASSSQAEGNSHEAQELCHADYFPAVPSSTPKIKSELEQLPTYADLSDQEPHRFGRWRGWIEKRARERMYERTEERREAEAQGRSFGTGWDPPDPQNHTQSAIAQDPYRNLCLNRNSSIISSQNEHAAFASAAQNHKQALHRSTKSRGFTATPSSTPPRPYLEPGPGAVKLTPSTSVHQIGSRFLPQFHSQPLCAIPLPLNNPNVLSDGRRVSRFLLVGTADGLYVIDLVPALSHTVKTDSVSSTDSKIYKVWDGLGIHQLEIAVEEPTSDNPAGALTGIVIGLTTQLNGSTTSVNPDSLTKSIKMWPLQSMINLVKFRAFSENSECLDVSEPATSSKRLSALSAGTHALAGLMSIFDKGKHRADSQLSSRNLSTNGSCGLPDVNRQESSMAMPVTLSQDSPRKKGRQHALSSNHSPPRPDQSSTLKHSFVTSPNQSYLELPLQWAKQSIPLDLPRIHAQGPILFIKLSHSPIPGFNPLNDAIDVIDPGTIPIGLRPRSSSSPDQDNDGASSNDRLKKWLYLMIVTKQTIFVLTSQPAPKRTWHLCSEMTAPFSPKTVDLVCAQFPWSSHHRSSVMSTTSTQRGLVPSARHHLSDTAYGHESVLVTMKEYAVVIKLSDLSVREIDLQGAMSTSQSTGGTGYLDGSRKMTGGSLGSLASLDGVHATFMGLPRSAPGSNLSSEPVLTGRKVGEGGGIRDDGFRVDSRRLHRSANDRRWIGCVELLIPVTKSSSTTKHWASGTVTRSLYLMTRGHLTYTVLSPVGTELGTKRRAPRMSDQSASGVIKPIGVPCPIVLKPIHTFTWRAVPVKVRAHVVATPSEWDASFQEGRRSETTRSHTQGGVDELFCCLTAFTASGIEIQEGFISLGSVRSLWEPTQLDVHDGARLCTPFFTPASQHRGRPAKDPTSISSADNATRAKAVPRTLVTEAGSTSTTRGTQIRNEDREVTDTSSYDYNAKIGFLCDGGAWFSTGKNKPVIDRQDSHGTCSSNTTEIDDDYQPAVVVDYNSRDQGQFFWKESMGEWKIMYLCHDAAS